jgi:DNA repair protein RecO (recombination protein O)
MRVENEAAYVLEARPYRETSLLIEAFTARHGRIALVARGIRGESRRQAARRAALEPFRLLRIGFAGLGEVMTLTAVEPDGLPLRPVGAPMFAGLYVNELVQKLTGRGDAVTALFSRYSMWLAELADLLGACQADGDAGPRTSVDPAEAIHPDGDPECADTAPAGADDIDRGALSWSLRRFERDLLAILGYALALDHDSDSGMPLDVDADYALDPEHGARPWTVGATWPKARGSTLLAWAGEEEPTDDDARELKHLARLVVRHHLGGVDLRAWKLASDWRTARVATVPPPRR